MSLKTRVQFEAKGFRSEPEKLVTVTLEVTIDGLPADYPEIDLVKELLVRMAIILTDPVKHDELARDLVVSVQPKPRRGLKRVK